MYLYLNNQGVIIDIVEDFKPVRKNKNGITVFCSMDDAEGYIGSDDQIYAKLGVNLIPAYTDIIRVVMTDVPEEVVRLAFKYIDGEFIPNEDTIILGEKALSESAAEQRADIDYIAMETGVEL